MRAPGWEIKTKITLKVGKEVNDVAVFGPT